MRDLGSTEFKPIECVHRSDGTTEVWLRRDISKEMHETENGQEEHWTCEVVHGVIPGLHSEQAVAARFAELWERFERESMTLDEKLDESHRTLDEFYEALAEIAEIVG